MLSQKDLGDFRMSSSFSVEVPALKHTGLNPVDIMEQNLKNKHLQNSELVCQSSENTKSWLIPLYIVNTV